MPTVLRLEGLMKSFSTSAPFSRITFQVNMTTGTPQPDLIVSLLVLKSEFSLL